MLRFEIKSLCKQEKPSEQTKYFNPECKQTNIENTNLELCKKIAKKQMTFLKIYSLNSNYHF